MNKPRKYADKAAIIKNADGRWVALEIFGSENREQAYSLVSNLNNCLYVIQTHEFQFRARKGTVYARYKEGRFH